MAGVRRQFSDEFKQKAVRVVTVGGVSMAQSPRDLEIRADLLRVWVRTATNDAAAASGGQSARVDQAELTRLPTEVATLRMERDILKSRGTFNHSMQHGRLSAGVTGVRRGTHRTTGPVDRTAVGVVGAVAGRRIAERDRPRAGAPCRSDSRQACCRRRDQGSLHDAAHT